MKVTEAEKKRKHKTLLWQGLSERDKGGTQKGTGSAYRWRNN